MMVSEEFEQFQSWLLTWEGDTEPRERISASALLDRAEACLAEAGTGAEHAALWHRYLNLTGLPAYLQALPDREARYRWAESAFRAIQQSDYTLLSMLEDRVSRHPSRTWFQDRSSGSPVDWSYGVSYQRIRALAGFFYQVHCEPRVALFSTNCVEMAWCDLACLCFDILNTPLNVHSDVETLAWVFDELGINIAVTDTPERFRRLQKVRGRTRQPFEIFCVTALDDPAGAQADLMRRATAEMGSAETTAMLDRRRRKALTEVATVMFTSGSTGRPKGISFSIYNLVSKRFARAAALPQVGVDEVLLCYLPFYHTFGRYFELMGSLYWSGTYVFPGNPSPETLLALLREVNPTGLISIPLRWQQIQDRCLEHMERATHREARNAAVRDVIGQRLHWGLSAAGYLPPSVFRFFNHHGVALCSGFGMTEATGGIMMTPPGEYQDQSIGIPLPGISARLSERGELQISGPYIGRYLDEVGPGQEIPAESTPDETFWLSTGDVFKVHPNGHYEIVDRLKDIYKNNKGQTIAPQRVEKKFENVPGIHRVFLVGDAREYNGLLIVPDLADPVLEGLGTQEARREYFHQLVTHANQDLAVYERVVNFAVLSRDFQEDLGELTSKGSYRRKQIEAHFSDEIEALYQSKLVELTVGRFTVRIPRWIYRDLGILDDGIQPVSQGLFNRLDETTLILKPGHDPDHVHIGDLCYRMDGHLVDLGLLARSPALWIGNPSLIRFCPCKPGWDVPLAGFLGTVALPAQPSDEGEHLPGSATASLGDPALRAIHNQIAHALFGPVDAALAALERLQEALRETDERLGRVIRRRLEALSRHPEFAVRAAAYRVLLLDEPSPDYGTVLPSFVDSGLPFLDETSIQAIASADLKARRLAALRQRLFSYRTQLSWPASPISRQQFSHILKLLAEFAVRHPEFYDAIRSELASWVLLREDPDLSADAERFLAQLRETYEAGLEQRTEPLSDAFWKQRLIFGDELSESEIERIQAVLVGTTFLKQSIVLAFDEEGFEVSQVPEGGIWVSKILARRRYLRYRLSINTVTGKHFDLQVILKADTSQPSVMETIYWLLSISSYPHGTRVLPRFGCSRPELGARSMAYMGELTVWERIREFASQQPFGGYAPTAVDWRRLFVRALATLFRAWRISGKRIVPGVITPDNVVVPGQDFRVNAAISSLTGWTPYENTLSLVKPMLRNFFHKAAAHYPSIAGLLDPVWILDAAVEEMGVQEARDFLSELRCDLARRPLPSGHDRFITALQTFIHQLGQTFYVTLSIQNAVDRYNAWASLNPSATARARQQIIDELMRLYRLDQQPLIARYYLFCHTYFQDAGRETRDAFARLLDRMFHSPEISPTQMVELSDVQASLQDATDRAVFGHMIFPRAHGPEGVEVYAVGDAEHRHVVVRTTITDKYGEPYTLREPVEPAEIGQLYRLFFREGYPKTVTERDCYVLVVDADEQIVGGLCFRYDGDDVVHIDGSVIAAPVMGRGIGSALLEDFCARMTNQHMRVVKTHFFLRRFYQQHGFEVDARWGALVRFLGGERGQDPMAGVPQE